MYVCPLEKLWDSTACFIYDFLDLKDVAYICTLFL